MGKDGCVGGQRCALYLKGVPRKVVDTQRKDVPFVASGLFPYEQKVSVVHGTISRLREHTEPLPSKQEVWLHCGFRHGLATHRMSNAILSTRSTSTIASCIRTKWRG